MNKPRILIIEDDDLQYEIYEEALANCELVRVSTGTGALKSIAKARPDLILTGLQSDDMGYGQTGVVVAELLGIAHSTIIMHVDVQDTKIRVKRELEDGWFQNIDLPLPALLTIQSGATKLRYATLMGIKKAKTKEVRKLAAAELGVDTPSSIRLDRIYMPGKTKKSQIFDGPAK